MLAAIRTNPIQNNFTPPCKLVSSRFASNISPAFHENTMPKAVPAYFHPSFTAANPKKIEELSRFLDLVSLKPEKIAKDALAKMSDLIKNVIETTIKDRTKLINFGQDSSTYRINDKYVFKIRNNETFDAQGLKLSTNSDYANLKTWYGGSLVETRNVSIMKNADPEGIQIPAGAPYDYGNWGARDYYKERKCASKIAAFPQEAFDAIAQDMKELNKKNRGAFYPKFDYDNPNNFLIINNQIRVVDDLDFLKDRPNIFSDLLKPFLMKINAGTRAIFNEDLFKDRRKILKKCIFASEKSELPLKYYHNYDGTTDDALLFSGLKINDKDLLLKLQELRKKIPNIEKRLEAISNYIDDSIKKLST